MQEKFRCAVYTRVSTDMQAEVKFNSCESQEAKIKSFIDDKNVMFEESKIRFQTAQPMESLAKLHQSGQRFRSLKIQTANLEDVFLNLTGRRLRD